ncbi:MAG TPA: class I fructose-bisphosphate aldolase [Acidimicrobiia bacterium]
MSIDVNALNEVARAIVAPGKGILAADESSGTIKKRFDSIGVESTEDNRRDYREMLFRADVADAISGVILYDETIRQQAADGTPLVELLEKQGIIPGIKVDLGAKPLALAAEGETVTEGLDGLRGRLEEYRGLGAKFAKWRATYTITDALPSRYAIDVNAHALARYAALCQEAGIVPIIEPEVLMDGTHTIGRAEEVTHAVHEALFHALFEQQVSLPGVLLKPNMVLPGYEAEAQVSDAEIAATTVRCFRSSVPAAVPGIVFLSGGQSDEQATARLNEMNKLGPHPWELSFSYGRALQAPALKAWKGEAGNLPAAQSAYVHRAKMNRAARFGEYNAAMEKQAS